MKYRAIFFPIFLTIIHLNLSGQEAISPDQKEWIETVRPIMTDAERDVFKKLRSGADRDKFIQFFWRQRDPVPETPENEFRKEFDERVKFADLNFRSGTGQRGSRTERGFFYLALGKPLERHLFTTQSQMWPLELWYFQGDQRFGLPPYFYLVFYQPQGLGDYRLYHPGIEGPEKLVVPLMFGQTLNRGNAYRFLRDVSTELASASLSYIPGEGGERTLDLASLGSESVIASARGFAERKFNDAYARTFADYKDFVETDYSDKFVGANALIKVFSHAGQPFLHWSVEPDRISFAEYQGTYYASFEVILRLEDKDGVPLLERTEEVPIRLTPEQYKTHERRHLAFQDILPVIPGDLRLFILLKNKTGKDFTTLNAAVAVAPPGRDLQAANLLLYHARDAAGAAGAARLRAFTFDGAQYVFNARNEFLPQENLGAFLQVLAGAGPLPPSGEARLEIFPADKTESSVSRTFLWTAVADSPVQGIDIGPVALEKLAPGYYRAEVSVVGSDGRTFPRQKENFIILAAAYPVLPWVFSRQYPAFPSAEHLVLLGSQRFMTRDYAASRGLAERALAMKDEPAARLLLGRAAYALKDFTSAREAVRPLFQAGGNREAAKIIALSFAESGDWAGAIPYLESLMKEAVEIAVLNLAADCYAKTGEPAKAVPLLEKSLSLEPNQPSIRALLDRLRK